MSRISGIVEGAVALNASESNVFPVTGDFLYLEFKTALDAGTLSISGGTSATDLNPVCDKSGSPAVSIANFVGEKVICAIPVAGLKYVKVTCGAQDPAVTFNYWFVTE